MTTSSMKWAEASAEPRSTFGRVPTSALVHVVDADPTTMDLIARHATSAGLVPVAHQNAIEFTSRFCRDALSCVVLDAGMRDINSLELLRGIQQKSPGTPVIMVGDNAEISVVIESMRSGAVDFLEKPISGEELFNCVLRAIELAHVEWQMANRRVEIQERIDSLSPREFEVMMLLRKGRTVKEIAYDFGLSHKTVQVHRARVLRGMRVDSLVLLTNLLNEYDSESRLLPAR